METTVESYVALSPVAKLVLMELYTCASEGIGIVGVPLSGIARRTGVQPTQVMKALDELKHFGFLDELATAQA